MEKEMQQSFGGYFELELQTRNQEVFHPNSILLNTGRNALEYIIRVLDIKKIYLPLLSCEALLTPINRTKINYEYYSIDNNQMPCIDFSNPSKSEYLLYINYFGLKNDIVETLKTRVRNLIIDNTQAFFSLPSPLAPTFYSTRKFFGVSDGALVCNVPDSLTLNGDKSSKRMMHLLLRAENELEVGYPQYLKTEANLNKMPLLGMSDLTRKILLSLDYESHRDIRNSNFSFLADYFPKVNKYRYHSSNGAMAFPLWIENGSFVKQKLKEHRVYIPTFWPGVLNFCKPDSIEADMVNNILPIPIDKRYSPSSLFEVVSLIRKYL